MNIEQEILKGLDAFYPDYGSSIRENAKTATEHLMADREDGKRHMIKAFILQSLAQQREEILRMVEGMKNDPYDIACSCTRPMCIFHFNAYNQALRDLANKIKSST